MHYNDVFEYFGNVQAIADAFQINHQAISQWRKKNDGYLPEGRAFEAQVITGGKLKAFSEKKRLMNG